MLYIAVHSYFVVELGWVLDCPEGMFVCFWWLCWDGFSWVAFNCLWEYDGFIYFLSSRMCLADD
jgi:hypothetical protein